MKKLLLILLCLPMIGFCSFPVLNNLEKSPNINECDNIIFKDGNEVLAKIIEITPEFIKYRKCDKLEGPLISIYKKDILMLRYSDGTKNIFKSDEQPKENISPKKIKIGILSIFSGIISLFFAGIIFAPTALILGIVGLNSDKEKVPGIIGTILGTIGLLIILAALSLV